jgi:hypothetical protein
MSPEVQRMSALRSANAVRLEKARIRRQIRAGELSLWDVLMDPPDVLRDSTLLDVLELSRARAGRATSLAHINERAMEEGVNLLLPVRAASQRSRAWLAANGTWHQRAVRA